SLDHDPPQPFGPAQDASPRDGTPALAALPLAGPLGHELFLPRVRPRQPLVDAGEAVDDARLTGGRRGDLAFADGALVRPLGRRDREDGEERRRRYGCPLPRPPLLFLLAHLLLLLLLVIRPLLPLLVL